MIIIIIKGIVVFSYVIVTNHNENNLILINY